MDYVQLKMPEEKRPTIYCSEFQSPGQIIILNSSRRSSLKPDIEEVARALDNYQGPMTLFSACQTLCKVLKISAAAAGSVRTEG